MPILVIVLVASFYVAALMLLEFGFLPWLSAMIAIPIAYAITFALSRALRSAGAI